MFDYAALRFETVNLSSLVWAGITDVELYEQGRDRRIMVHICVNVGGNGYRLSVLWPFQHVINQYKDFPNKSSMIFR